MLIAETGQTATQFPQPTHRLFEICTD